MRASLNFVVIHFRSRVGGITCMTATFTKHSSRCYKCFQYNQAHHYTKHDNLKYDARFNQKGFKRTGHFLLCFHIPATALKTIAN